jgi:hypothetical protein
MAFGAGGPCRFCRHEVKLKRTLELHPLAETNQLRAIASMRWSWNVGVLLTVSLRNERDCGVDSFSRSDHCGIGNLMKGLLGQFALSLSAAAGLILPVFK